MHVVVDVAVSARGPPPAGDVTAELAA